MTEHADNPTFPMPPGCARLMDRLQLVLDGELTAATLDADAHAASCSACRERIRAARLLFNALPAPAALSLPSGLTDSILATVREDRFARMRHRSFLVAGGAVVAIAASLLLAAWFANRGVQPDVMPVNADRPDVARATRFAPESRPTRLGAEFAKVGQTIMNSSKPITEPAIGVPGVLGWLSDSVSLPAGPPAGLEPTRDALADLPETARIGLEPVASTTQRAFARLVREIGSVQVGTRQKS